MTSQEVELLLAAERQSFHEQLPALLRDHRDKAALFKAGQLVETFETLELAFDAGVERFGVDPFLVERISESVDAAQLERDPAQGQ